MLNEKDLTKLSPYFAEGKVVSIDVKDRNRKGREVVLEYEDGRKLVVSVQQVASCQMI